ncbi:hypothetical protein CRG98_008172 [Punica granatum]|uniref:Uncharacterized protein n=1 Tax=Punica granatum TaxID=22663 RepID=A0A2I0KSH9_PUNGR|nr:hypothetical protein CRG98_008172 [Punica granatum]
MAYVEGNLDWMRETGLDITRELDRSNGYSGNQPVYPVPLDPGDSTALDLRFVNSKWRLILTCVRRASLGRWILPSLVA